MSSLYKRYIQEMYIHGFTESENDPIFRVPENFDSYREGSGWQAYRGGNDWEQGNTGVAVYLNPEGYNKEMARIWFEIKYPDHLEPFVRESISSDRPEVDEIRKWGKKASVRWIGETARIRKNTRKFHGEHDGYARQWVERKPWKECFIMALQSEAMKPFVKKYGVDKTKWVGTKRCELNENLQLKSKFWWINPKGQVVSVGGERYSSRSGDIRDLLKSGFMLLGYNDSSDRRFLELNYDKSYRHSPDQWKALKRFVSQMGADEVFDVPNRRKVWIKENKLNESGRMSKYWWMDEQGDLTPVGREQHAPVAREMLKNKYNIDIPYPGYVYGEMYKKGYIRVGFSGLYDQYVIEITYDITKPPSQRQWKALKDLAIEMGASDINDNTGGRKIRVNENRLVCENFHENKEWFIYEGSDTITAVFEDNSRRTFKVHYRDNRLREDKEKHRQKAARTWKKLAMEIRKNAGLNKAGNPIIIPWYECFEQALKKTEMLEYIDDLRSTPIFESYGIFQEEKLTEMTYDELRNSMKRYRSKSDLRRGTVTGSEGRERGAKEVRAKSLKVTSTVGKDGNEHETSLFSYKSYPSNRDPRAQADHPRWQGYIRFVENKQGGKPIDSPVAPTKDNQDVEVNCNCPDYKYVWAKANSDNDAGVTRADGGFKEPGFRGGGNDNNNTYGKRIRNPENTPGLCKHLIAVAEYIEGKLPQVAPADKEKEEPDQVAPKKSKLKKTGKPINIFESIKQFALQNPSFDVYYDD